MSAARPPLRLLGVPNVSEGRDAGKIGRLAHAFADYAILLDTHSDERHNRTVFTVASAQQDIVRALVAGASWTVAELTLEGYEGLHPHVGVLDVCPVVFVEGEARDAAREQALAVAHGIAELGVPVFLYGALASAPERRERSYFRRGGPAELARRMERRELVADLGPRRPHPTAGATLVTARPPLAAFNLELEGADREAARSIAAELREAGNGLPGVRAIGLDMGDGRAQVSTNVHDPHAVPLAEVVARVRELAAARAATVVAGEVVGLVPAAALDGFPDDLPLPGFERERGVIEERLAALDRSGPGGEPGS